jgi:hypothetical protein
MLSIVGVHLSKFIAPYPRLRLSNSAAATRQGDPVAGMFPAWPGFAKTVVIRRSQNIPLRATG